MAEGPAPSTPPRTRTKKAKRECHFIDSWTKDYKGIAKSRKGM